MSIIRARRTMGPTVVASFNVGKTRLTVMPCFSLSATSRRRSWNSAWWKFDSANQRSTRAGTARDCSAARSAAASDSPRAASSSNVAVSIRSRVFTTITGGLARVAIVSGRTPNRKLATPDPSGAAEAPMITRSDFSASLRIAFRTLGASRRMPSACPRACCFRNAASACSACARTVGVRPGGTTWRTVTRAPCRRASASAKLSASSACGPPRTGTRIRWISAIGRCLTTAMSQGDSRTTASIVGLKTSAGWSRVSALPAPPPAARREPRAPLADRPPGRPPQPKITRSASSSTAASTIPWAARRPIRTTGRTWVPSGA